MPPDIKNGPLTTNQNPSFLMNPLNSWFSFELFVDVSNAWKSWSAESADCWTSIICQTQTWDMVNLCKWKRMADNKNKKVSSLESPCLQLLPEVGFVCCLGIFFAVTEIFLTDTDNVTQILYSVLFSSSRFLSGSTETFYFKFHQLALVFLGVITIFR